MFPDNDPGLLAWSANFSERISAGPVPLGLTAAQATAYGTLHSTYAADLLACDPGVRNKAAVNAKNVSRLALKNSAKLLANIINGQASVTNEQKIELGLTVRSMPTPIGRPTDPPAIDIMSVQGRTVEVRLHDSTDASRRGKPPGVDGASIWSFVGDEPPANLNQYEFEGNTGKTVVNITFPDSVAPGAKVWILAFWFSPSKESGPACQPVSAFIQQGISVTA